MIACSCATESSPRCHASPVHRSAGRDDVRERLLEREHGERLVERRGDAPKVVRDHRLDERVPKLSGIVERGRARLVEDARRLADAPAVADPVAQPLDPLHVRLAVAPLTSRRAHRPQDAVALLPLAKRVGRDAGAAREGGDVEEGRHWTFQLDDRSLDILTRPVPEGDSLHRAAIRLQPLVGRRVAAFSPHPRGQATGVARVVDGRRLESVEAVGKHLLLRFEGGVTVRSHLRMTGRWSVGRVGRRRVGRPWLVLEAGGIEATQWNGPVLTLEQRPVRRLGPDLLAPETEPEALVARFRRADPGRALGEALQDQLLVAGIGNMWMAERSGRRALSPWRSLAEVERRRARRGARVGADRDARLGGGPSRRTLRLPPGRTAVPALRHADRVPRSGRRQQDRVLVSRLPAVSLTPVSGPDAAGTVSR